MVLASVVQDNQVPVPLEPSRVDNLAGIDGRDLGPLARLDVDAVAERPRAEPGVDLGPVGADEAPLGWPGQLAPQGPEPAGGGPGPGRRRGPGRPPLPLLEGLGERLEPPRGLGQLAPPALGIGTPVAHPGEETAPP